ncbi:MAG: hypothetical protein ACRED5_09765 [Propylenella sp.]
MPVSLRRLAVFASLAMAAMPGASNAALTNDYPTESIAEYVYACMKANGETPPMLSSCSCSIDVVASLLTYDRYVEAGTFLGMMQLQGEGGEIFRNSPQSRSAIQDLRRAQAEADVRCFKHN